MHSVLMRPRWIAAICVVAALVVGSLTVGQHALARGNADATVKQTAATGHTIDVGGHAEVTATPDMATLTIGVQTKASDAQSALSSNASKMSSVVSAIEGQSVAADHIMTSDLSLYLDSQSNIYVASHDLTVRLDNVNKVGPVLDAAVAAGANNSWGVDFGLKDSSTPHAQALQAAIADARKRADSMAGALGVSITGVATASESSATVPPPIRYGSAAPAAPAASTQVQPGQLTISADVSVSYTFG